MPISVTPNAASCALAAWRQWMASSLDAYPNYVAVANNLIFD